MKNLWDEPYYVTFEIKNEKCKVLKLMNDLGIQQFKIRDIKRVKRRFNKAFSRVIFG